MPGEDVERWMRIGTVAGPFGVHGEIKVDLLTDFPERFSRLHRVFLGPDRRAWQVDGSRFHGGRVLLKLEGMDTPEAVRSLRNAEVAIPRAEAMSLPEGHYYLDDLIGARVDVTDGRELGRISEILRTGSNDVYVVQSGGRSILIPAIKDAVETIDLDERRVVIHAWVLHSDE